MTGSSRPIGHDELLAESAALRRIARALVRDPDLCEELVQDTWLAALRNPPTVDSTRRDVRGWLATVAERLSSRSKRDQELRRWHESRAAHARSLGANNAHAAEIEETEQRLQLAQRITHGLVALPEPYRSAVRMHYLDGLTQREVAERQGVTHDAARQRVSRGLAMLRGKLEPEFRRDGQSLALACAALAGKDAAPALAVAGGTIVAVKTNLWLVACVLALLCVAWFGRTLLWPADERQAATALASGITTPSSDGEKPAPTVDATDHREALVQPAAPGHVIDRLHDLHGIVLSPDGALVAGASVKVLYSERQGWPIRDASKFETREVVAEMKSDERGEFAVPLARGRPHQLEVRAEGCAPERRLLCYAGERVVIQLQKAALLHGHILHHPDGAPIVGARIVLRTDTSRTETPDLSVILEEVVTDAEGEYRTSGLGAGHFYLSVVPGGGFTTEHEMIAMEAGQELEKNYSVADGRSIHGRVVDDASGEPIENAEIALGSFNEAVQHSDASGRFTIGGLTPPEVGGTADPLLFVRAPGHALTRVWTRHLAGDHWEKEFDLRLLPEIRVHGRVIDANQKPVEGALIIAFERGATWNCWLTAHSDAAGEFVVGGLSTRVSPGVNSTQLLVAKPGYGERLVDWRLKDNRAEAQPELGDIRLEQAGFVAGTLIDEQKLGIAGQMLTLRGLRGGYGAATLRLKTDDLGRFACEGLPAGNYTLSANWKASTQRTSLELQLADGQRLEGLELVLPRMLSISGGVRDSHGAAVARAYIEARSEEVTDKPPEPFTITTGDDGRFVMQGVPSGLYTLRVQPFRAEPSAEDANPLSPRLLTGIAAGSDNLDVRLVSGGWIKGVVLEVNGHQLPGAYVVVVDPTNGGEIASSMTPDTGRFAFALDPRQPWTILSSRHVPDPVTNSWKFDHERTHQARAENVTPGGPELELKLPPVH